MVARALAEGLPAAVTDAGQAPLVDHGRGPWAEDEESLACAMAVVEASGAFDRTMYLERHPEILERDRDPLEHYCRDGWRIMRNPHRDFDAWWYWSHYLDPAREAVEPLLHWLLVGRRGGLPGLPPHEQRRPTVLVPGSVRRACLVAGFDRDGLVDPTVVDYVRELSRFGDVFYLAACPLDDGELEKLAPWTADAWAVPHGSYDFGSYAMLASTLVGWDRLETYDEVLLVNDSCYLLRSLDEVFAAMERRECDWWGLQVTARHFDGGAGGRALPDVLAHPELFPSWQPDYDDYLHVGSYFLGLRRPVLTDPGFRRRLERVAPQRTKINIIYKYETGTTRYLLGRGFTLGLFVDDLLPYHPMYGPGAFDLVDRGLPVLKRGLLAQNPYDTPDLADWRQRVAASVPDVDPARLDAIDAHLRRVAPHDRLLRSARTRTLPDGTVEVPEVLRGPDVRRLDRTTAQRDDWWAFPVCAYSHTFTGNERAVFDLVRDDPDLTKVVLTRSRQVEVEGANVHVVPVLSPEGQELAARCRTAFIKHSPRRNIPYPLSPERHDFINLWHGIPLKRFGLASVDPGPRWQRVLNEHTRLRAVIASSRMDKLAMSSAFKPVLPERIWVTGLPRNDYIVCSPDRLPPDLAAQEQRLQDELRGRRLVLFLPTFKQDQEDSYHHFDEQQVAWLRAWCDRHDAVLGIREHMADRAHVYSRTLAPLSPIDLSSHRYPDLEVIYRSAAALVTDYSSCVVDFMLTGRPVLSFAYDLDRYEGRERGLFYPLEDVLPGPVCRTFDELAAGLDDLFRPRTAVEVDEYDWKRGLFFDHTDDSSSARVVDRVRALRLGA
ncbi:CDP-glycerol glycerophosphotransferase family protein [Nocardioides litoris]|uniref:CDP-glycerol glycerophosphotransferase family protein n=1 Tax=Nocardioides litoris TaxID=1926648 RepID=UPI0011235734|nr:CDP-glycerol glycerophosphotransferase family protein [Nocardioides litoris]